MEVKWEWWHQQWSSSRFSTSKVKAAFLRAQNKAMDTELEPITVEFLRKTRTSISPKKAKGCEALGPRHQRLTQ
eukprot:5645391-Pyramimonas_sp.AAC.1